ncbi:tetratricopeptide repeat protein [candidate division WOR-3 bacterium]|nr:tetratricopeptide repeat protein [candidate division WOR-3 bacterium]
MAIKGSLAEASLPDVIQLLAYSGKSGCLSVTDGKNFGNIFIKEGKIIYATILNRKQRLGDILVVKQAIDNETLSRALEIQKKNKKKRLGEILIEIGALDGTTLEHELKEQIEQTIFTMLTWETGYFNFEADLLPSAEEYTVQLSAQELLLEGARRIDEWRKIENKIPPFETVLIRKGEVDDIPLTTEETKIIDLIDGTRSIDDLLKLSDFDFFETCRTIYGLLSAGLLVKPEKPLERKKTTTDITEYKNLGIAFYKTDMYDEAEREYNKILEIEEQNAEAHFYLGLIELMRGNLDGARQRLMTSYNTEKKAATLINLGYIALRMGSYDEAIEFLQQAKEAEPDNNKVLSNLGIALYMKGAFQDAITIFARIIENSPEIITPYIYLAMSYYKTNAMDSTVALLKDAIDRFPRFTVFKNNLAVIYEGMDKPEEAEKLYRQALEVDPQNEQVSRNLADFYYEAQILGAAKELYEKIPEDKRGWEVYFKLGNISLRQGDAEKTLMFWEQAQRLNPSEQIIARNIEVLQKSSGK